MALARFNIGFILLDRYADHVRQRRRPKGLLGERIMFRLCFPRQSRRQRPSREVEPRHNARRGLVQVFRLVNRDFSLKTDLEGVKELRTYERGSIVENITGW